MVAPNNDQYSKITIYQQILKLYWSRNFRLINYFNPKFLNDHHNIYSRITFFSMRHIEVPLYVTIGESITALLKILTLRPNNN